MQKKVTLATIKSFVRKAAELYVSEKSRFDGMVDCVMETPDKGFSVAIPTDRHQKNTLGIQGLWFVGDSRDYFYPYNDGVFQGYTVSNCCGSFVIATKI